jgi:hypothetical protein
MSDDAYTYIPDEVREKIPRLYATENVADPTVWVKLFTPDSSWTWFITEYDGEDLCFGLVKGHETELGYFSLAEITAVRGPLKLRIERDLWFEPKPLSAVR